MSHGGRFGQKWDHQNENLLEDIKLGPCVKHYILKIVAEVKKAQLLSYQSFNPSMKAKKLSDKCTRTNNGAHGEQPIGFLFHSEVLMYVLGGQIPYNIFKPAGIVVQYNLD